MKKLIWLHLLMVASSGAFANDVLMEACNNLPDSAKRLECFKAIPKVVAPASDAEVKRAFGDLQAILSAGTSYNSYGTQLEIAVKATSHFVANATGELNRKIAALLDQSLQAHKDAQAFWQADIKWYARRDNYTTWPGGLPVELTGTGYLVSKYNLRTQKSDFWGLNRGLPRQETLTAIWAIANHASDEAFLLLSSGVLPEPTAKVSSPTPTEFSTEKSGKPATSDEADVVQKAGTAVGCTSIHTPWRTSLTQGVSFFNVKCIDDSVIQVVCSENVCQAGAR